MLFIHLQSNHQNTDAIKRYLISKNIFNKHLKPFENKSGMPHFSKSKHSTTKNTLMPREIQASEF